MGKVLRFRFDKAADKEALETDVVLAIFTAECVYGRPRVRMEISYLVAEDGATCVLEVSGESGEMVSRVLAGLVAVRLGEEGFSVERPREGMRSRGEKVSV